MAILKKILHSLALDSALFLKIENALLNSDKNNKNKSDSVKFWLYAESLGEFRLALYIADIIKEVFKGSNREKKPIFFISFKTNSTFVFASNISKNNPDNFENIIYFFHPALNLKILLKPYIKAIRPDYFIAIEHLIPPALINELIISDTEIFLLDINHLDGLKNIFRFLKKNDKELLKRSRFINATVSDNSKKDIIEKSLLNAGIYNIFKITAFPLKLKFGIFLNAESKNHNNAYNKKMEAGSVNNFVLSFVSVHKKESKFILKMIEEIVAEKKSTDNIKFIIAPRNTKLSSKLFKIADDLGLEPLYIKDIEDIYDDFFNAGKFRILIVNDYGILNKIYAFSDTVYVGKSLFKGESGGHNILEPASFGKPVLTGGYADNFKDIVFDMLKFDAITVVSSDNFKETVYGLLNSSELRHNSGLNALKYCDEKRVESKKALFDYLSINLLINKK